MIKDINNSYRIDVHGYTVSETAVYLNETLDMLANSYEELVVVHGYHEHILLDYIRKKYRHPRIEEKKLDMNPGVTVLTLKKEYVRKVK